MTLLGEPAPDFSDPLALLGACHQRMLDFCDLLDRLPAWINEHGVDDEVIAAAGRVMRYFDSAARLHHQDEEHDLFPLLDNDPQLAALVDALRHEHQDLEASWTVLANALREMVRQRNAPADLATTIAPFCSAYRGHIAREDGTLLPRAAQLMTVGQLAALGISMAARRSIGSDSPFTTDR